MRRPKLLKHHRLGCSPPRYPQPAGRETQQRRRDPRKRDDGRGRPPELHRTNETKKDGLQGQARRALLRRGLPLCTSFEPSLVQFVEATRSPESNAPPVQLIYVSSDMDEAAAETRAAAALGMDRWTRHGPTLKTTFKLWFGRERPSSATGAAAACRRSSSSTATAASSSTSTRRAKAPRRWGSGRMRAPGES